MKKILFQILILIPLCAQLSSCNADDTPDSDASKTYIPVLDARSLPIGNRPMELFKDDENPNLMYDKTDRWFRVNAPLQVIQSGKDSIQLSLYSPVGLKDVKIYAKIPNFEKRILIFDFSEIPSFHRSFHQIPFVAGTSNYITEHGNRVNIQQIPGFSNGAIEFSVESTDPLMAKFKKIKSQRLVQFESAYHTNELGKFLPMNPVLAKEAITMMINFSYALSHPLYYDTFMNFDRYKREQAARAGTTVNGALDWHGNAIDENGVYDYLTKAQIQNSYNAYLDSRTVYPSMVGGGSAFGGGPLASQWESGYVRGHWLGDLSVFSHEYSHHVGYGHDSNLANSGQGGGQQEMLSELYRYLIYLEDLPFLNPEVLQGWTKTIYLNAAYQKPVFTINPQNTFLLKYNGTGKWN